MTTVIPLGTAQVTMKFGQNGALAQLITTFGVNLPGVLSSPTSENLEDIYSAWEDTLRDEMSDETVLTQMVLTGPTVELQRDSATFGTRTGSPANAWETAVLTKKALARGRGNIGRMFHPGLLQPDEVQPTGGVDSVRVADISGACDEFLTALTEGAECPMVILHNSEGASSDDEPAVVASLFCSSLLGIQKRRRSGD